MNYDKISYLVGAIFTLGLIFLTSILFNYGRSFIDDPSFDMYFGWYLGLVLLNLFNILVNLIYHYFMKDLIGPRGLKGEPGERGLPGKDDRCMCEGGDTTAEFISLEGTDDIQSYSFTFAPSGSGEINFSGIAGKEGGSLTLDQNDLQQISDVTDCPSS